jgi:MSHA biogenesis protein MshK
MNTGLVYNMAYRHSLLLVSLMLISFNCFAVQLADPTMPAGYKPPSSTITSQLAPTQYEWTLNTTVISPSRELAIINGKVLSVGDEINGAILLSIEHQQVKLSYKDDVIILKLHHSFISQLKSSSKK